MANEPAVLRVGPTLSIDPRTRTLAHAFFEDGELRDCQVKTARSSDIASSMKNITPYVALLLDYYAPHAVLFPKTQNNGTHPRGPNAAKILKFLKRESKNKGFKLHLVSEDDIRTWLVGPNGARIRDPQEVNREVLKRYPELAYAVPKPRAKAWEQEQHFQGLFNAVAMYLAWERMPSGMETKKSDSR